MWKQITKEKKGRDISTRLISLTTICLLVYACMVTDTKGQNTTKAEQLFQKGLEAYKGKKWGEAAGHFHAAYGLLPHSQISYCLSCCYHRLKDAEKALKFANKALKGEPTLKKPYSTAAQQIQDYAAYVLKERKKDPDFIYMIESSIDYPGRVGPIPPIPQKMTVGPQPPRTEDLTGTWKSGKNGIYFIRQIGNEIWWYGESPNAGRSWANVFHGTMKQNNIRGTWADLPKGRARGSGTLRLQLEKSGRLKVIWQTGSFGDTSWTRYTPKIIKKPVIKPKPVKKPKPVIKPNKFTPIRP